MKKYIAAVSGGPDSMSLLNIYKKRIVAVCHVNYHDREDTDNDQQIVEKYCKENNLKLHIFDTEKDDISKYKKYKNPQTFYRHIRYDFFKDIANQYNVKTCLVAHNKDDFIESAYMVIQSKKISLHMGIRKRSHYKTLKLYRPLIRKWKDDLKKYCLKNNIDFATDYTNEMDIYKRNITRKIFLKKTKFEKNKFYFKIMFHNFKNSFLDKKIRMLFSKWKNEKFSRDFFLKINMLYKQNLIYLYLLKNGINTNKNKIDELIKFINSFNGNNKKFRIKEGIYLTIENKNLIIKY